MAGQLQGQPAAPNPNAWATDLYSKYQGAAPGDQAGLIQQMQGQDMGKAFNDAMKNAGYTLNQQVGSPGNFSYAPPPPPAQTGAGAKPGMGAPPGLSTYQNWGPNSLDRGQNASLGSMFRPDLVSWRQQPPLSTFQSPQGRTK